jgi:hypothetical protein
MEQRGDRPVDQDTCLNDSENSVAIRDERGRYLKGIAGGPGRPVGSRNKLSQDFLGDLQEDWDQHGPEILRIMREKSRDLLPKLGQARDDSPRRTWPATSLRAAAHP